jgi:hypothetical protein
MAEFCQRFPEHAAVGLLDTCLGCESLMHCADEAKHRAVPIISLFAGVGGLELGMSSCPPHLSSQLTIDFVLMLRLVRPTCFVGSPDLVPVS